MSKQRLDILLVERGLCPSRKKAQALIMSGKVLLNERVELKPGKQVKADAFVQILEDEKPFVGRGGLKLRHALDTFTLDPSGYVAADIGASTGGFTDCLLQAGACRVYAVDVGYGQLDYKLRQDKRVVNLERTNVRYLDSLPEKVDLVVIDVSFISLRMVLPVVRTYLKSNGRIVCLFKPQFEVSQRIASRFAGVIDDESIRREALDAFVIWIKRANFELINQTESPIVGDKGNHEYLLLLRPLE